MLGFNLYNPFIEISCFSFLIRLVVLKKILVLWRTLEFVSGEHSPDPRLELYDVPNLLWCQIASHLLRLVIRLQVHVDLFPF